MSVFVYPICMSWNRVSSVHQFLSFVSQSDRGFFALASSREAAYDAFSNDSCVVVILVVKKLCSLCTFPLAAQVYTLYLSLCCIGDSSGNPSWLILFPSTPNTLICLWMIFGKRLTGHNDWGQGCGRMSPSAGTREKLATLVDSWTSETSTKPQNAGTGQLGTRQLAEEQLTGYCLWNRAAEAQLGFKGCKVAEALNRSRSRRLGGHWAAGVWGLLGSGSLGWELEAWGQSLGW